MANNDSPSASHAKPPQGGLDDNRIEADYRMLAEMIRHQHDRFRDHTTVFMSILSALSGFIVWFAAEHTRLPVLWKYLIVLSAATGGLFASLAWFAVMRRILVDTGLRYFQLRYCERAMKRPYKLFSEGERFFKKGIRMTKTPEPDGESLVFEDCLGRCPVKIAFQILAGAFALGFLLCMVLAIMKIGGIL